MRSARIAACGLALLAVAGCKPLDDAMVFVFGRSMRDQRSFDPYENTRPAPENAIPFASANYPAEAEDVNIGQPEGVDVPRFTQMDMVPLGTGNAIVRGLENPFAEPDSAVLARGEIMYLRFCAPCHGGNGIGAEAPLAQPGLHPLVAAYNLAMQPVQGYSDPYLYGMIRVGRGLMPEYGSRISHFDRWRIVAWVRELQQRYNEANPGEDD